MKRIFFLPLILFSVNSFSQTIERQVFNSIGNSNSANGIILRTNIGEALVNKVGNTNLMFSQGFYTGSFQVINTGSEQQNISVSNSTFFYPNPTFNQSYFNDDNHLVADALIENMFGQIIAAQKISNNSINLESFAQGFYFIKLYSANHRLLSVSKIIKQ